MTKQHAAVGSNQVTFPLPQGTASVETLANLNRDILVSTTVLRHSDYVYIEGKAPIDPLAYGDRLILDFPNCKAEYVITGIDTDSGAMEAEFVKAHLKVPRFYRDVTDAAFGLASIIAQGRDTRNDSEGLE